jgi:hypothetical protein
VTQERNSIEHITQISCPHCEGSGRKNVPVKYFRKEVFDLIQHLDTYREPKLREIGILFLLLLLATVAAYTFSNGSLPQIIFFVPALGFGIYTTLRLMKNFNGYYEFREKHKIVNKTKVICAETGRTLNL